MEYLSKHTISYDIEPTTDKYNIIKGNYLDAIIEPLKNSIDLWIYLKNLTVV